jgi:hypothetical protein
MYGTPSKSVRLYPSISISARWVSLYGEVELDPSFSHHCTRCIGGPPIRIIIYNLRYVRIYLRIYLLAYYHGLSWYVWSNTWNGTRIITCILVRHCSLLVPCGDTSQLLLSTIHGYYIYWGVYLPAFDPGSPLESTSSLYSLIMDLTWTLLWRGPPHCIYWLWTSSSYTLTIDYIIALIDHRFDLTHLLSLFPFIVIIASIHWYFICAPHILCSTHQHAASAHFTACWIAFWQSWGCTPQELDLLQD